MSSEQPEDTEDNNKDVSIDAFSLDIEANHLIRDVPRSKHAHFIERIDVKPGEQLRVLLGSFSTENSPKGFSIALNPDPKPLGSVVTQVTSIETPKQHKLILHIANYSNKAITAEVWRL
ncbi:MAG: hypothetical protein ACREGD_00080 [Candidatus Saccharimonadales bacterium]